MAKGKRGQSVPRPAKKQDYQLICITRQASKGWVDAISQFRNAMADAWDTLTATPTKVDGQRIYILQGELKYGTYQGQDYLRYQYKVSDAARIWYYVDESAQRVFIHQVHPGHPKPTE